MSDDVEAYGLALLELGLRSIRDSRQTHFLIVTTHLASIGLPSAEILTSSTS
jgi:hypothetical protein